MKIRICQKCGVEGPEGEVFYKNNGNVCKKCRIAHNVAYKKSLYELDADEHRKQKVRLRKANLMRRYGLTMEQAEALYQSGDQCHVCGGPPDTDRHYLNIDHCHETGKVRGLLCSPCNRAIGLLQDDPAILRKAALYLEGALHVELTHV